MRLDHFRGFYNYWSVPAGRPATAGRWEPGPGRELIDAIRAAAPALFLLAEDLGDLDEGARAFPAACGVPGMRVLVFAFDSGPDNAYLPHNCPEDCAVYTGTHDTPTFVEFLQTAAPETAAFARTAWENASPSAASCSGEKNCPVVRSKFQLSSTVLGWAPPVNV